MRSCVSLQLAMERSLDQREWGLAREQVPSPPPRPPAGTSHLSLSLLEV